MSSASPLTPGQSHNLKLSRTVTVNIHVSQYIWEDLVRPDLTMHLGSALKIIEDSHTLQDRWLDKIRSDHFSNQTDPQHTATKFTVWKAHNFSYLNRFRHADIAPAIRELRTPLEYLRLLWLIEQRQSDEIIEKHEIMDWLTEGYQEHNKRPSVQMTEAVLRRALADEVIALSATLLIMGIQARALGLDIGHIVEYERLGVELSALVSRFLSLPDRTTAVLPQGIIGLG